ncbi:MAG: lysyl oxidase family protein [Oligoflexia bacterium]|nr:lysyl oxidase family protein [Oligoflexia bacterium]
MLVRILGIALSLILLNTLLSTGCGSSTNNNPALAPAAPGYPINSIEVSGQDTFADGSPIASKTIQYQIILDGANMFQAGIDGCLPTPAHVAGTVIENATSDLQGQYSLAVPITSLKAAVVKQCWILQLHSSQVEGVTLRASILADDTTCPGYCSAQGDPSETCVDDCETGNRTIIASQSLSGDALNALIAQAPNGYIAWTQALVFSGLGPVLTPGGGPDLQVDGSAAQASAHVDQESFDASSCEVAEQCVRAPGLRTVLRFDGTIENLGAADLVVGNSANSPLFTASSCHNVKLLKNIMLYELVDPDTGTTIQVGNQDVIGRKQGFCMMDITQINATAPQGQYDCDNQGITQGWADVYDAALECQFLDVTGVPAGNYLLRLTVNPDQLFTEIDYSNNTVSVPVTIPSIGSNP